ncbi:MAG: M14 family zinc carboxypeptidase [Gemmatimonadales bacterium]
MSHACRLLLLAFSITPAILAAQDAPPASATISFADGLVLADRHRQEWITERRFTHQQYWGRLLPALSRSRLQLREIGRSMQDRELYAVTFGRGPVTVLLWSQMHGDESTSTMALADILHWMAAPGDDLLRHRLSEALTVVMVPMLNPDGAERFQRENAAGIDINRDARRLSSPEGRALKALRDSLQPDFGFNLHDQNARTRAGRNGPQAAIALLAPAADAERSWGPERSRARLVAAGIARSLAEEIPGRVAVYDDAFNPRAFGDLMQTWGTSTVLIESGALPGDPQKQQLRRLHVAVILGALDAIATGAYQHASEADYDNLPPNIGGAYDLLIRGGQLVLPGMPPLVADVAINFDDPVARTGGRVREVGDLSAVVAIDTVDASGAFLHPRPDAIVRDGARTWLPIGTPAALDIREGLEPLSPLRRRLQ